MYMTFGIILLLDGCDDFLEQANNDASIILTFVCFFSTSVNANLTDQPGCILRRQLYGMQPNTEDTITDILMLQLIQIITRH